MLAISYLRGLINSMLLDTFRREWASLDDVFDAPVAQVVDEIVSSNADSMATVFYETMLNDPQAGHFLSHAQVKSRLHASLVLWLQQLFDANASHDGEEIYTSQTRIGDAHARVDIPVSLVLKGARALKTCFATCLDKGLSEIGNLKFEANRLFCTKVDLAMEVMSQAYASSSVRKARSSEAYRLFSITENLATEKEKQKAALLDWESHVMYKAALGSPASSLQRIRESEFGLWFRHKGMHAFQGVPECDVISQAMDAVDERVMPALGADDLSAEHRGELVREIRSHARNIQLHLASLFAHSLELESGKDVLTRLLNRKFLSTVLVREIEHSRKNQRSFSLAMIDIDHFKVINDTHGHEAGDQVIQQLAGVLSEHCRGGDFLFRMGGEEFLVVLVDVEAEQAMQLCERMRLAINNHPFLIPDGTVLAVTASIGVASYSGHPDYHYLLRQADEAVYAAKDAGRNRVVLHGGELTDATGLLAE